MGGPPAANGYHSRDSFNDTQNIFSQLELKTNKGKKGKGRGNQHPLEAPGVVSTPSISVFDSMNKSQGPLSPKEPT